MTTLLRRHPEQNLPKSRFVRYLQYFRDVGHCYILTKPTSGLCQFVENSKLGGGKFFSGTITTLFRGHTETMAPHPSAHTPHTTSKANPPTPRSGPLKVVGEPLPRTADIFVFDSMLIRCGASGYRSVKTFQHLRFARSDFVLSDHLCFSSFSPVEFATPAALLPQLPGYHYHYHDHYQ